MKKFLVKVNGNQYEVEVEEINSTERKSTANVNSIEYKPAPSPAQVPALQKSSDTQGYKPDGKTAPEAENPKIEAPQASTANASAGAVAQASSSPAAVSTSVPAGANAIKAPMPGTILRVDVSSGQKVLKGQVLLILEAMKMENEIVAPSEGIIASVNVTKGMSVSAGDPLVSIS